MNRESLKYVLELPPLITDALVQQELRGQSLLLLPTDDFRQLVLSCLDINPVIEPPLTEPPYLPLGKQFERLAKIALELGFPDYALAANVQLPGDPTPGEFDFLLTSEHEILHIEVAIKFFLYIPAELPEQPSTARFFGTYFRDRLDLKLRKLFHQQLQHEVPQHLRLKDGRVLPLKRGLWLSGKLFYPWTMYQTRTFPDLDRLGINPKHRFGWWVYTDQLSADLKGERLMALTKSQWIQPWSVIKQTETGKEIHPADYFATVLEPQAVLRVGPNGDELDRGFIMTQQP